MSSTLVTGASGFIGGWLARKLVERGDRVTVLLRDDVRISALDIHGIGNAVNKVHGELIDPLVVGRAVAEYEVDTVFHLAAQTIVPTANRSPVSTFEANIRGTWTMLEACRSAGVARTVVASSDKAYGAHDELPYREDFALQPRFPYDVSKAATDMLARSYWHTYELPVAVTRLANVYGGGDLNASRLVPECVSAVIDGRAPVIRSDGSPERDFLYVEDAAAAYIAIADTLEKGGAGEAYNAGGERPHSVREVVELICKVSGSDVKPDIRGSGTPEGEIDRQSVDSTKLREQTGWRPEVPLEEGIRQTVEWYRDHPEARS